MIEVEYVRATVSSRTKDRKESSQAILRTCYAYLPFLLIHTFKN